ncbi:histidine kinase [Anaerocolumna cellulosilytica]|uniref:histidine kinase n=1 Tax=Anaerocolumna cellulosilytica TaxID=433286 RepID=A0A6S6QPP6_9FIRM|nr:ATP-binding protein [Anaerocolumna cellulosilytica]MBB5196147.1 anti-sigma regulatory factor (Ser/Thr protein kinase) [Anaerocolumna cellulosilytica]BCJ92534.1 histidine kinase [Anaerocolumna cellulosilytica]
MMTEISLHVLDAAQNSLRAGADFIQITVRIDTRAETLTLSITDNGCGMTAVELRKAEDPFYTTRTTRTVGLGIPFLKQAALLTGGHLHIASKPGGGTTLMAVFKLNHIDRMPLGDMALVICSLVICHTTVDFLYCYHVDNKGFTLDTREFREILKDIPFYSPEVSTYIKEYFVENQAETDGGIVF